MNRRFLKDRVALIVSVILSVAIPFALAEEGGDQTTAEAMSAPGGDSGPNPGRVGDSEKPAPGVGLILPPSAVLRAPDNGADLSDLDPGIPLDVSPSGGMPKQIELGKQMISEAIAGISFGEGDGSSVDLAAPGTPASFLSLVPSAFPGDRDAGLGPTGGLSFQGYPATPPTGSPPVPHIAVGRDYVIAGYNSYYVVYRKYDGHQVASFNMSTLFSGLPLCGSPKGIVYPQVLYDDFNGGSCPDPTDPRFILTAMAYDDNYDGRICIAVSKSGITPTTTGSFWKYEFNPSGTGFPDVPRVAAGPDALIVGYNWFGSGYAAAAAISKANLYAGTTPTVREYTFSPASTYQSPVPAVRIGCMQYQTPTYNGTFLATRAISTNGLQLWRWPSPAVSSDPVIYGSSFQAATTCTNPSGSYFTDQAIYCGDGSPLDVEQRGDWLFTTRGVQGGAGAAIQWAKIDVSGASPAVTSGTVSESGNYLWIPSIASDRNNDFALTFSRASQTNSILIGAAVAGSEAGTWGSILVSKAGESVYNAGTFSYGRYDWGFYSGFAADPEDGCTLWANAQYAKNGTTDDATWIATYKFNACQPPPTAYVDDPSYSCFSRVNGTITDLGGTPVNAVYHSTSGGSYPATISGGPDRYTVSPVTIAQLGAADGDSVWLSFKGSDLATHSSTRAIVRCAVSVCISKVDSFSSGCDGDVYLDRGETLNLLVQLQNNEAAALPTEFYADLRVDPDYPDSFITIVNGTARYAALDIGAAGYAMGRPFQVRCTGGTNKRTVHFEIYNIRAVDGSWTGGSDCSAGNLKFTRMTNANDTLGTPFAGFPQSFDGTTFPPTTWAQIDVVGTALNWARATSTQSPVNGYTPHSGLGMAYTNSYLDANVGDEVRLYRTVDSDTTSYPRVGIEVWMFHNTVYPMYPDDLRIQASSDGGSNWFSIGAPILRTNLYGGANNSWARHVIDASDQAGGKSTVRIGLLSHNEYGYNIYVDDVSFAPFVPADDNATCSGTPAIVLSSNDRGAGYRFQDTQCNGNGYADAGESGTLLVSLTNTGNEDAYGVTATLSCPTCPAGVEICKDTAFYGDIPYSSGSFSQPDNGFQVMMPADLAAGMALPWVVTVNAANPYTTTITLPTEPADRSRSGTFSHVDHGNPYGHSIEDDFTTAPNQSGTAGRVGFNSPWTVTSGVTRVNSSYTDSGYAAKLARVGSVYEQTMEHAFSTVGIDGSITFFWEFNAGMAPVSSYFFFEWDNGDGNGWRNIIPGGTGYQGLNYYADGWVTYGIIDFYWVVYNAAATGYGPSAANACLNNPAFKVRFRCSNAAVSGYWEIGPFRMETYQWQNTATACAGTCLGPDAAVITEVRDVDPCALTGIRIHFNKGMATASTDLYKDGALAAAGYTSGTIYSPGDSNSHDYTIRAINTYGDTDSSPATPGVDGVSTGTPTFACTPGSCIDPVSVLLTTQPGFANYQWYKDGLLLSGATSSTFTVTGTGVYRVAYRIGACTNMSVAPGTTVTIGVVPPRPVPDGTLSTTPMLGTRATSNGSRIDLTYDASCSTDHSIIYGNLANVASLTPSGGVCGIGTTVPYDLWTTVPTEYDVWWVIVGDSGSTESSWGLRNVGGIETQRSTNPSNQCGNTAIDTAGTCP